MSATENKPEEDEELNELLAQALAIDPEAIYARGYKAWQAADYNQALVDFSWLVMSQPWSWRAHIALAGTWMMLQEYQTAINFYGYALMLDACHPEPIYQIGNCLKAMGELGLARESFQTAVTMSYADTSYSGVRKNAEAMLDLLLA